MCCRLRLPRFCRLLSCAAAFIFLYVATSAHALVVLQYHHISDHTPKATSTTPEQFAEHLQYLADQQFDVIGLDQLAKLLRQGQPLPDKTAVITFDDGYISVYKEAFPQLQKHNFPFAVFINAEPHDAGNRQFMSWQQMQQMAARGVVFANHTVTHPHLVRQHQGESRSAWRIRIGQEIKRAETTIAERLGQSHKLVAYPFGEFNAEVKQVLSEEGYLGFGQQSGPLAAYSDRQALPRFPFGGVYGGIGDFATKVNTLPMPLRGYSLSSGAGEPLTGPELPQQVKRPVLVLALDDHRVARQVSCFASGQGAAKTEVAGAQVTVQAREALPVARSRYNCTAPSGQPGRYYWHSELFIRRQDDGTWYRE